MDVWIALISGLIGAVIGAAGSVGVVMIQANAEQRRHRLEMAVKLAEAERAQHIEVVNARGGRAVIYPISLYLSYYTDIVAKIAAGQWTEEEVVKSTERRRELQAAYERAEPPPEGY